MIFLGADHRGYRLKETIKRYLEEEDTDFEDLGNINLDPGDDYVDFAKAVAEKVSAAGDARGIVICGSGAGADIVVNKIKGIRGSLMSRPDQAGDSRNDDDINVLVLSADFTQEAEALEIVDAFLKTPFSHEERHIRRLEKIKRLEEQP